MRSQQVVYQRPDLAQIKFGGGVRVHHRGVVDVSAVFLQQCTHSEFLHIDLRAHQRNKLRRDVIDYRGLNPVGIDEAGGFYGGP